MNARFATALAALVVATAVLAEVLLQPSTGTERTHLLVILVVPAVVTAALVVPLRRWVSRRASVAGAALLVGFCSLAVGAFTTSAASNAMFVSGHDYRLFLVFLVLSCGLALVVGMQLSAPLARDISRLGQVAQAVAAGDLSVQTGITRRDEVGRTAATLDSMVGTLRTAADERAHLAQARRLLFTGIGHDLRTPLAAMRAALESLHDGLAPDPDRYFALVGSEMRNIEALLDQLTVLARLEAGGPLVEREAVSITEVADEAVEALGPLAARHGVTLTVRADGPAVVYAVALDISRCLRNLVDNAIGFSPAGADVRLDIATASDGVEVTVADQGAGFDAAIRDVAFEPFTRADAARSARGGHTGLGLAITRALVQQHGGRAWLGPGPGGDVHLWIPRGGPR